MPLSLKFVADNSHTVYIYGIRSSGLILYKNRGVKTFEQNREYINTIPFYSNNRGCGHMGVEGAKLIFNYADAREYEYDHVQF